MATLAELQERLEDLRTNRALGALMVRTSDGRTVTYRSDAELAAAMADLERQIATLTGTPAVHTVRVAATKGLDA